MGRYRCYLLGEGNKIGAVKEFDSVDDAASMIAAPTLLEQTESFPTIEVWQNRRIVGCIEPPPKDEALDI